MEPIDVYHQWLGIPPQHQPPSLYRLLGISDFESDSAVIRSAAERQAMHVRRLSRGRFIDAGQELLNEIAYAKLNLIDPVKRQSYDETLRQSGVDEPDGSETENHKELGQTILAEKVKSPEIRATLCDEDIRNCADPCSIRHTAIEATFLESISLSSANPGPWLLGYHSDCDVIIDHRTVSGMHCRISRVNQQWQIDDLNSTNGTFINGKRISRALIRATDLIVLGGDHRVVMPPTWFGDFSGQRKVVYLGRAPGNELRSDSKKVSRFHARLIYSGDSIAVEDLQSVHGTFLVDADDRTKRLKRHVLLSGQRVQFADSTITFNELAQFLQD